MRRLAFGQESKWLVTACSWAKAPRKPYHLLSTCWYEKLVCVPDEYLTDFYQVSNLMVSAIVCSLSNSGIAVSFFHVRLPGYYQLVFSFCSKLGWYSFCDLTATQCDAYPFIKGDWSRIAVSSSKPERSNRANCACQYMYVQSYPVIMPIDTHRWFRFHSKLG